MRLLTVSLAGVLAVGACVSPAVVRGLADSKPNPKLGFNPANMDTKCKPCEDFNTFANGGWMTRTQIPAAYPSWGSFYELYERNQNHLHDLLEEAAKNTAAPKGSVDRLIADFYASAMDESAIEAAGTTPLKAEFDRIAGIKDAASLQATMAHFQSNGIRAGFRFSAAQDFKNSSQVIGDAAQGGLGLPDRDYYFKDDERTKTIRAEYVKYVADMFALLGEDAAKAEANAKTVMALETKLADASMTLVEQRDPNNVYHKMDRGELKKLTATFSWDAYLTARGVPNVTAVNVEQPKFFTALDGLMKTTLIADWQVYLRWCLIDSSSPYLSAKFVQRNFDFRGKALQGTKEIRPRWKRMTDLSDQLLGEALGQLYVRKHFSPEAKAKVLTMLGNLRAVLRDDINSLEWMSPETRTQAIAKLDTIVQKIGYPDKWKDYSSVKMERGSFLANLRAARRFEIAEDLAKIGKPVDRAAWQMSPPTVNAYYDPQMNEIVFPAGILQPPFYDPNAEDAVNYGGIGAVIGHEISHGFDDQGRQFDKDGNLKDWWTEADAKNYLARATCVEEQFSGFKVEDVNVNGKLVLGEAIADLGGLTLAYLAYQKSLGGKPGPTIEGFTADQRFFMGWAQVWQSLDRPESIRLQVATDPHPPAKYRINGTVANMPAFAKAFGCTQGDAMARKNLCRIW